MLGIEKIEIEFGLMRKENTMLTLKQIERIDELSLQEEKQLTQRGMLATKFIPVTMKLEIAENDI